MTHIDALWEIADKIAGPKLTERDSPFLNPLEAFVLGSAFILHDLAQSKAALQMTDEELRADERFCDILADERLSKLEHTARWAEALGTYLRERHAELSVRLLTQSWPGLDGTPQYLLVDEELRSTLARAIGLIAASHHLSVNDVGQTMSQTLGAPVFLSDRWDYDMLKLACLIRVADAAHLDARRAPAFLAALRKPTGISAHHWDFQTRLNRVRKQGDRLEYSSSSVFPLSQIEAWWLCFDSIQMVDRELREVDALLSDRRKDRYEVKAVAGADDPRRFSALVPTEGWLPFDTQIRVGNVAALVKRLGGRQLYGNHLLAPLREMLQNASDAIIARRLLEERPATQGQITVELIQKNGDWRLAVTDDGIGMSVNVLTGALLDFGTSFWSSSEARKEFPGLRNRNFKSTGRFGIGFFSVFMLGEKVKVTSRRFDSGVSEAKTLEFLSGPESRPVLRSILGNERKAEGTRVEVQLDKDPYKSGGLLRGTGPEAPPRDIHTLCAWLCPSFPVDIVVVDESGEQRLVVKADDWLTLSADKLLSRIEPLSTDEEDREYSVATLEAREICIQHLRPLLDAQGEVIGRAAIQLRTSVGRYLHNGAGVVSVGGARAQNASPFAGIVLGHAERAARDKAKPLYTQAELVRWTVEQVDLIINSPASDEAKASCAEFVLRTCGDSLGLPFVLTSTGWISFARLVDLARNLTSLIVISASSYSLRSRGQGITLTDNVLVCESGVSYFYGVEEDDEEFQEQLRRGWHQGLYRWNDIEWHVVKALSVAWAISEQDVEGNCSKSSDKNNFVAVIANDRFGNPVEVDNVDIFTRPKTS